MKILTGSLLFATAIFINFRESNSYPPNKRARPTTISKIIPFKVLERDINVDAKISVFNNHCTLESLNVVGEPLPGVPTSHNRGFYNYTTRAVYHYEETNPVKIVVYIKEDDKKKRTLMGVKLPPTGHERQPPDDPRHMNPDELHWYITYEGTDFTVEIDPQTKRVFNIKPRWFDNKRPDLKYLNEYGLGLPYVHFGGLYFMVFKKNRNRVVGAALDPYWMYRPGQELENQHPHFHPNLNPYLNPQLSSQPNPPLDPQPHINPEPPQHVDSHHNLPSNPFPSAQQSPDRNPNVYQQQNLYQDPYHHSQQNLYQDPYHYPQPTFDPNTYHQQNVGSSHHFPQQDANPLPNFDPFENWGYPPYHPPTP